MMLVVEPKGLALIPWNKVMSYLMIGFQYFFKLFIIVGGSIPYVFQYAEVHHRRNSSGFSLFVCLALFIANILRILFWFGKRFDNALLAQSIVMLICMVFMLEIAVRMNRKHTAKPLRKSILKRTYHRSICGNAYYSLANGKWDYWAGGDFFGSFWAWHDLESYLIALGVFTAFWSLVTFLLVNQSWYVEAVGLVALLCEATLALPQLWKNLQRKSTQGMSIPMVLAWLCGDLAKTGYFVITGSPLQFWICAILQISIDCFILGQVFVYRKNTAAELPYNTNQTGTANDGTTEEESNSID